MYAEKYAKLGKVIAFYGERRGAPPAKNASLRRIQCIFNTKIGLYDLGYATEMGYE